VLSSENKNPALLLPESRLCIVFVTGEPYKRRSRYNSTRVTGPNPKRAPSSSYWHKDRISSGNRSAVNAAYRSSAVVRGRDSDRSIADSLSDLRPSARRHYDPSVGHHLASMTFDDETRRPPDRETGSHVRQWGRGTRYRRDPLRWWVWGMPVY